MELILLRLKARTTYSQFAIEIGYEEKSIKSCNEDVQYCVLSQATGSFDIQIECIKVTSTIEVKNLLEV